jgi:acyl-CoA thioester hydrolase
MPKTYTCPIEIRAYELDASGHVNHANYLHYFEHARWNLLEQEDITLNDFKKWALWPIIVAADIQYLRPAFLGDQLKITTQIIEPGKASYVFEQTLLRNDQILVRGRLKGAMMDYDGKPARIPEKMMKIWENTR